MMNLLAQTAAGHGDFMVSGKYLIAVLVAIIPVLGGVWLKAKAAGKSEGASLRLEDPVPEVPTRKVVVPPSFHQFQALDARVSAVETEVREFRNMLGKQFQHVIEAGMEREVRILDKLDDVARAIHARIDQILQFKK